MTAIKLENVSFRYPDSAAEALSEVNLEIPQGSFFAMLGPNGAGKTTLLRLLCGRFAGFEGSLKIADEFRGENGFLNPKVYGVLLENPGVYPRLSIEEYVNYFAGFYGCAAGSVASTAASDVRERAETLAKALELPALSTRLSALSLGNRQKVQILRAMVHNPKLLILDEPVANLDPMSRETVWRLIAEWRKQEGGTAIVCSHILAEMEQEATDFAIIDHGRVLKTGPVAAAVGGGTLSGTNFELKLENDVTAEQIQQALAAAGINNASVQTAHKTLSDLYRGTIRG